ncbi:MAG TPA: TetR/AcrR family transcriptional regulator [Gaiellaceae bacterium]|jgi:AcrR family transcriptional regulator|nr:TetR/AcrR family transcriptional regulator [Gaiellaceae bacterium]
MLVTKGQRTRHAILDVAARLATEEGLEPLSIGRLAEAAGMSKSGLFAHFGSKEELQLATVDHAASIFVREVIQPARAAPEGLPRVWALCEGMIDYAERQVFPGGCFFASASFEFKRRPGPVRERIEASVRNWRSYLEHAVQRAQEAGDVDGSVGAREIAFELDAYAQAANAQYQLFGDTAVFDEARRAVRKRLESLRPQR